MKDEGRKEGRKFKESQEIRIACLFEKSERKLEGIPCFFLVLFYFLHVFHFA
jgi:hypothetical protein